MNKDVLQAIMLAGEIPKNMQTTDNLVTEISSGSTDEQYPSAKAVYDQILKPAAWELLDQVDCSGGDVTEIKRENMPKKYRALLVSNNSTGQGAGSSLISGTSIRLELRNPEYCGGKLTTGTTGSRIFQLLAYCIAPGIWHFMSIYNALASGGYNAGTTSQLVYKNASSTFQNYLIGNGTFQGTIYVWGLPA